MKAISLFSCGGIGDLGLRQAGFNVIVANELLEERAEIFKYNFPDTFMIVGNVWNKKHEIIATTKKNLSGDNLDIVFATPPCQGMSKNGRGKLLNSIRQGIKNAIDPRNLLVIPTVEIFKEVGAHTLVIENVPEMENTYISDPFNAGELIGIIDFIKRSLGPNFLSSIRVIEFANYGVPQCRQRLISVFTRNEILKNHLNSFGTLFPKETHSKNGSTGNKWVTVRDVIADTPYLDAGRAETAKNDELEYHRVPLLDSEKYFWVSNTPEERSAFDNQCTNPSCSYKKNPTHGSEKDKNGINKASTETPLYCIKCGSLLPRPWVKESNQYRLMKGYTSAYKRMSWDSPASTLTRNLSYACSDNKLHPSQNRVLSLYEAMRLHTISNYKFEWKRADRKKVSDKLIRELIGESIPPAGLEAIFLFIKILLNSENSKRCQSEPKGQQELCL